MGGAVLAAAVGLQTGAAGAEQRLRWPLASFSADLEVVNGEARGPQSLKMAIFSAGARLRLDFSQAGDALSIILDRRARRMIAVSHRRKQAVLLAYRSKPDIAVIFNRARGKLTREGVETVNGIRAVRYKFEGKNADGDTFDGHIWMTRQRIIVRMLEARKRPGKARPFRMNLHNLRVGKLSAGVFQPPKGYRVVDARKRPAQPRDENK